jgi:hypothetical protein
MLRKRQSCTVTWEQPTAEERLAGGYRGRVKIVESASGRVQTLDLGDTCVVDATLYLSPLETGWELLP